MSHQADDIGASPRWPGMPRLEAAEQARRQSVREEMQRHASAIDAELTKHHRTMDAIASEFSREMRVA
jgi:predicted outer membrane protein